MDQRVKYKKEKKYKDLNWNTGRNVTNLRSMFSKRESMEETTRGKSHKSDFEKIKNKNFNESNPKAGMKWKDNQRPGKYSGQIVHGLCWGSSFANQEEKKKKDDCSQKENFQREEQQKYNCKWPKWTLSKCRRREDVPNWYVSPGVKKASMWHRLLWHILELLTNATEKKCKKKLTVKEKFQIQVRNSASPLAGREWWHENPTDKSELYFVSWPHSSYSWVKCIIDFPNKFAMVSVHSLSNNPFN